MRWISKASKRFFAEEHPRMMILCNPHNPIGLQWSRETLAEVGRLCRKYNVLVISDEIHGDLMLGHRVHFPFAACSDDCAKVSVTFGAPSKTFNIPGLVSSWCVVKNPELREPFFHWLEVNEFNATTFVSTIGTEAAYCNGEAWLEEAPALHRGEHRLRGPVSAREAAVRGDDKARGVVSDMDGLPLARFEP